MTSHQHGLRLHPLVSFPPGRSTLASAIFGTPSHPPSSSRCSIGLCSLAVIGTGLPVCAWCVGALCDRCNAADCAARSLSSPLCPWDSFLIRSRIWSYRPRAILGPTLLQIPVEEIFFILVQTYITSLVYFILSKPTFQPRYLRAHATTRAGVKWSPRQHCGHVAIVALAATGFGLVGSGGRGTYLGMILAWAGTLVMIPWYVPPPSYTHQSEPLYRQSAQGFITRLPLSNTLLPILVPTLYFCIADTQALRRGTWVLSSDTKLNVCIWPHLEIEYVHSVVSTKC